MNPDAAESGNLHSQAARAARVLAADPRVQLVYLFGSAADPTAARTNDLDLAVLTDPPLSLDELIRLRADVVQDVPTAIDLVSLNDAPTVLAHQVVDCGRCLFARDPALETEFVTRTRSRYWDFKPYRDEQWRLAGERQQERLVGP
jgi:predicted nucleotidyltransferase